MQGIDFAEIFTTLIVVLPPLIFAVTLHEVAHGWVAKQFGDPTALMAGRITLNPVKHVDPLGTIIVPLVLYFLSMGQMAFGWAKPVPVAFNNLNNPRRDMILVAAAGPGSNILMGTLWALLPTVAFPLLAVSEDLVGLLLQMSEFGIRINVILAVFNMLPIPPLDGGRVLAGLLPPRQAMVLDKIEPFGFFIVIGLWYFGVLNYVIIPPIIWVYELMLTWSRFFMQFWGN